MGIKIPEWCHGYGYGYGDGHSHGYGDGHGHGYGHGYGYGHGHGYGYGHGYGHGYGDGYGDGDGHGGWNIKLSEDSCEIGCKYMLISDWLGPKGRATAKRYGVSDAYQMFTRLILEKHIESMVNYIMQQADTLSR